MPKEIKFRVWDKEVGKWLCEDSQYLVMDGSKVLPAPWSTISFYTGDENFVIQQFTGLKDDNNTDIYEGDVVEFNYYNSQVMTGVVTFCDKKSNGYVDGFMGGYYIQNNSKGRNGSWAFSVVNGIRVIGNAFENKDLLKS